jgi:energy-coupling factor transport system substrate-specific component
MSKMRFGIREVVAIGIGTALFFVLSYVSIPLGFIPNTSIQTRMALLAFFSAVYGPIVGGAVGFLGHALADLGQYGGIWWSWVVSDAIFGIIVGLFISKYLIEEGGFKKKQILLFNVMQIIGNAIAWVVVAPILDILIYAEPVNKVFAQGFASLISNSITAGVIGTLLAYAYTKIKAGSSSLSKED